MDINNPSAKFERTVTIEDRITRVRYACFLVRCLGGPDSEALNWGARLVPGTMDVVETSSWRSSTPDVRERHEAIAAKAMEQAVEVAAYIRDVDSKTPWGHLYDLDNSMGGLNPVGRHDE